MSARSHEIVTIRLEEFVLEQLKVELFQLGFDTCRIEIDELAAQCAVLFNVVE